MFIIFRVKCSNPQKRMVLKSKLKSNDTTAFDEFVTLICQNTTSYDEDIKDYTCTPPCEKPKTTKNIVNNWEIAEKPELADTVMHSCTNGSKIVSKLDFSNATPEAPVDQLELICTMSGKYDKGNSLTVGPSDKRVQILGREKQLK
jgi:hypothetical protein